MSIDVKVPVLPESVSEGTMMEWHKQAGDTVKRDDNLVDIETEKVVLEVTAPADGVLKEILKQAGDTVEAEERIGVIEEGAAGDAAAEEADEEEQAAEEPEEEEAPVEAESAKKSDRKAESDKPSKKEKKKQKKEEKKEQKKEKAGEEDRLSPAVRRLVEEHDLDPSAIEGTGRDGRLTKEDVLKHLDSRKEKKEAAAPTQKAAAPAPAGGERGERREKMSRLRATIARRLVEVQQTGALLTTFNEVDLQAVNEIRGRYRDAFEERHGVRLGMMSFFVKAAAEALRRFPIINASVDGEEIVYHDYIDIGIAVASPRGLVVPVLRDADRLSFAGIEGGIRDFGKRARDGKLEMSELQGGTFTITNGGVFGSLLSTPIVNAPQSAILGMHKVQERPMVVDGEVKVRPMMYLAVSYDHRIIDGADAVRFLVTIKEGLEDPSRLLLEV